MSNNLVQQQQGALAALRAKLAGTAFGQMGAVQESLSDGIGASYGIVHYGGKVWSFRYRGQTYYFTRPDDGTQSTYIDVVILRQSTNKSKTFYEGGYEDGANKPPTCSSVNGVTPDADIERPQSTSCALCQHNVWKDQPNGKKGRACSDFKRLAVMLMPDVSQRMLGQPLLEPVFLRVPGASLSPLAAYGDMLKGMGIHYFALVTRISFVPEAKHPQFNFGWTPDMRVLSDAEAPVIIEARDSDVAKRITGEDQAQTMRQIAAPTQGQQQFLAPDRGFAGGQVSSFEANGHGPRHTQLVGGPQTAPGAPATLPSTLPPARQPAPPITTFTPSPPPAVTVPAQQFAAPQQFVTQQPPVIDMAPAPQGTALPPWATPPGLTAAVNIADVGQPEEADADLDARLAALLPDH